MKATKTQDVYDLKLAFAISQGYPHLAGAIFNMGRDVFEREYKKNSKKLKRKKS